MLSLKELRKMAHAAPLLPPPGDEVVLKLLQEIYRLHNKLEYIQQNSTDQSMAEFAKEDVYYGA